MPGILPDHVILMDELNNRIVQEVEVSTDGKLSFTPIESGTFKMKWSFGDSKDDQS